MARIERIVDEAAIAMGMDRLEIRRKNFIRTFPYKTPVALEYDTGEYDATLEMALSKIDYANWPARKAEAAKRFERCSPE